MRRPKLYRPKEALLQFPSLWLPGSPLPSSRGMPGYPCCCGCDSECSCNISSVGCAPCCWSVAISGIVEGTCGSCVSLNGTYNLSQLTSEGCIWSCNSHTIQECDAEEITLTAYEDAGDFKVKVEWGSHVWEKNYGTSKPNLWTMTNESLPNTTSSGDCDSSSSTCLITKVADETACECFDCPCTTEPPRELEVTLTGIANFAPDQCIAGSCVDLNDVYVLTDLADTPVFNGCEWFHVLDSPACEIESIKVNVIRIAGPGNRSRIDLYQNADFTTPKAFGIFTHSPLDIDVDCAAFDFNVGLTFTGAPARCDGTSANAAIKAL